MAIKSEERVEGCFARAAEDEPLFVLRATDKLAPDLVRQWAEQYRQKHIKAGTSGRELARVILKHEDALQLAGEMQDYRDKLVQSGDLKS